MNNIISYFTTYRSSKRSALPVIASLFLFLAPASTFAQSLAGNVLLIKGAAAAEAPGQSQRRLEKGSEVFVEDTIITGKDGFLVLKMVDETKLTLRPNSTVALNEYNTGGAEESATVELLKGGLRAITGTIAKNSPERFQIKTPTATIGIRGTDFAARLCQGDSAQQCGNACALEERRLTTYERLASKPGSINGTQDPDVISECEPVNDIADGLYVALFDGQLNLENRGNELDIEALIAAQVVDANPECLIDLPNFISLDPYLTADAEEVIDLIDAIEKLKDTTSDNSDIQARMDELLGNGYPTEVIFNNEMSRGFTIHNIVDTAIVSDPGRETEFRWIADILLDGAPIGACGCDIFERKEQWNQISYDALNPKTVEEAARVFFEEKYRLVRLIGNTHHGMFPVQELADMLDAQELWYRILPVRNHPLPPGVFVSIYEDEEQVIVDGNLGLVWQALERGDELMPVMFQYYPKGTIPINRFPPYITSGDVSKVFRDEGLKVGPPPNWKYGDFHAWMTHEEIDDLVKIPKRENIDPELWDQIEADITTNGFIVPTILAPGSTFGAELFNSVERVAVARELGIADIPVVLFEPPPYAQSMSMCRRIVRDEFEKPFALARLGNSGGPSSDPPIIIPPDDDCTPKVSGADVIKRCP